MYLHFVAIDRRVDYWKQQSFWLQCSLGHLFVHLIKLQLKASHSISWADQCSFLMNSQHNQTILPTQLHCDTGAVRSLLEWYSHCWRQCIEACS